MNASNRSSHLRSRSRRVTAISARDKQVSILAVSSLTEQIAILRKKIATNKGWPGIEDEIQTKQAELRQALMEV